MTQRLNYAQQSPELFRKYLDFSNAVNASTIEAALRHLVTLRASQMNGCALRLRHVAIWRESPLFSARERAALAWTEVLTKLPEHGVPDDLYAHVRGEFSEKDISDLTFLVMAINGWNRINVGFRTIHPVAWRNAA